MPKIYIRNYYIPILTKAQIKTPIKGVISFN